MQKLTPRRPAATLVERLEVRAQRVIGWRRPTNGSHNDVHIDQPEGGCRE